MLLQAAAAQTTEYMLYGFIVILGLIGLLIASIVIRARNLRRDLEMLDSIKDQ